MDELISIPEPLNPYVRTFFCLWGLVVIALVGFRSGDLTYREQLEHWHRQRVESLKSENGWLNLAGLFWLNEGANVAGDNPGQALAFPSNKVPANLGVFTLSQGVVQFQPAPGVVVLAEGQPVLEVKTIFAPNLTKPVTLAYGSLRWFIIKRGDRYAVRLRDLESPSLSEFRGIDRYPIDESLRVTAQLERPAQARTIPIVDITGQTDQKPLVGILVFTIKGQMHRLDAVGEGPNKLFILFGDATNAQETYGSGRFLYADQPGPDGLTTLDFNQAINPPCAFTPFATCPLPPKQNRLVFSFRAGEKRYGNR